nr:hypothetical protein [Gulosibacter sp. 10]
MAVPSCRAVDAMPPATPARSRGRPSTAVFVMGAFAKPTPTPSTGYAANSHAGEEVRPRPTSSAPPSAMQQPAMSIGARGPILPTR